MDLDNVTFFGPPIDDGDLLSTLPANLASLLQQLNGFIQFHGGLHMRGACLEPPWHSLRNAWLGEHGFHRLYPAINPDDVPFAENCLGDQFILREGQVFRLAAETGVLESLNLGLPEFFRSVQDDPIGFLSLEPLLQFERDGGALEPGQLLAAYPPFCTKQAADGGVHLAAIPTDERRRFLAEFASQIRDVLDGGEIVLGILE
jgi:hypothetical protein